MMKFLKFETMLYPRLVAMLFAAVAFGGAFIAVVVVLLGGDNLGAARFLAPFVWAAITLGVRVMCEMSLVFFKIHQVLEERLPK